ncbi:cytochrome P450 [Nocardiopsis sp. LSu2-4]|uniref:Cytochrome P450 n=1 Tax=Nocardiopsis suaedae TaxID=3018444 RepID=A0ABT4TI60_9ACTN|nr:cytochrome P450 [Nocardiopsis suaedae]
MRVLGPPGWVAAVLFRVLLGSEGGAMAHGEVRLTTTASGHPAWLVSDHGTVRRLLTDPRLDVYHEDPAGAPRCFASGPFGPPQQWTPDAAEDHLRMRRLVGRSMSARRLAGLRPRIQEIVDGLLDDLAAAPRHADFHRLVSAPLPPLVLRELFGVPDDEGGDFDGWLHDAISDHDPDRMVRGITGLSPYVATLVRRRIAEPRGDVPTDLAAAHTEDPEHWTMERLTGAACLILLAGVGPTMDAIDDSLVRLSADADQWAAVRESPELVENAVEELLRLSAITAAGTRTPFGIPRWAGTDVTVDGTTIRKGELVLLDIHAASHDERHIAEPDRLDVHRTGKTPLIFGAGAHYCLGAPLARMQLCILFRTLIGRFPAMRLAVPAGGIRSRDPRLAVGSTGLPVAW